MLALRPLDGATASIQLTVRQVRWPEVWRAQGTGPQAPLIVDLGENGSLEVSDHAAWHAAVQAAGGRPTLAARMQTHWPTLVLVAVFALAVLWAFYRWGTPWAAAQMARFVPLSAEQALSRQYLAQLDDGMLAPSHLPAARQQQLRVAFDGLVQGMPPGLPRYAGYRPAYRLEFRSGMGANAFALPGGTIVMTDGIVRQAKVFGMPDDALLGVLAHEMGHVAQRHTSRAVLQQGVLQTGMSLALGDVSGIFASSATLLTGLAYSRAHEVEADCFAIALMRHLGKSTKPMGELLLALDNQADDEEAPAAAASAASGTAQSGKAPAPRPSASDATRDAGGPGWDWISTHPDTRARAEMLRAGKSPRCD
jgi:Zn-dependent protease with chaperone function